MFKFTKLPIITAVLLALLAFFFVLPNSNKNKLPVIAIANYGPHSSLQESIQGIKDELASSGLKQGEQVHFEVSNVGFDPSLIMQMLSRLKASKPKVLVAITTPVAQVAKNTIKDIPLVYSVITDPVEAGLLTQYNKAYQGITGSSDHQDLEKLLDFAKQLLPNAKRVGLLYASGESNDAALVKMMRKATKSAKMKLLAIPIDEARDVEQRMQLFKNKVDLIYVGASGPIEPSLPSIVSAAEKMRIPVFNVNAEEVRKNKVLASFGVSYYQVGVGAGKIINKILKGVAPRDIAPIYPKVEDYQRVVNRQRAKKIGLVLPPHLKNVEIVG